MPFKIFFKPIYLYHLLLFISFSVSLNKQIELQYINLIFYSLSHILVIYLSFYYFNFFLYFIFFIYGLFFDIFLLNDIGPHMIVFILLLAIVSITKKYLYNLSSLKILYVIFAMVFLIYFFEMILADIIYNYNFNFFKYFEVSLVTVIILIPIIFIFAKFDKLK